MRVRVEMLAFEGEGVFREVDVPDDEAGEGLLGAVFKWGQNDFQPRDHPSVSVGDVIYLGARRVVVEMVGFRDLSPDEYEAYLKTDRRDRSMGFEYALRRKRP